MTAQEAANERDGTRQEERTFTTKHHLLLTIVRSYVDTLFAAYSAG